MDVEKGYHHAAAAATASAAAAAAATSNLGNCSNSLNHHESVELLSTIKVSSNHLVLDGGAIQEKKRLEEEDSLGNDISSALEVMGCANSYSCLRQVNQCQCTTCRVYILPFSFAVFFYRDV